MKHLLRRFAILLIAGALVPLVSSAPALASKTSSPGLYVPEASITTMDGVVLWARHPDKPRRVASCIKMLNALVVRENADLDDVITISKKAASVDDGAVGLVAGQKYTVRQLLGVMLVHSANGAAEALATGIGGSEKKYVSMMNAKAKSLGLKHTRATDPHGLGPRGYSTANDLSTIARQLMADPVLRSIVGQTSARLPHKGSSASYSTTNGLLGVYPGMEGIKTGYTDPAGYCFVGSAKRNGVELLGVVLGANASNDRFTQMRRLLDWGFKHAVTRSIVSRDATMGVVEVLGGTTQTVTVRAEKALTLTAGDENGSVTTQVSLPTVVRAPVQAGQTVGAVLVAQGGSVVASVPLVAERAVAVSPPAPRSVPRDTTSVAAAPSLWQRIAGIVAGFGRMLGI